MLGAATSCRLSAIPRFRELTSWAEPTRRAGDTEQQMHPPPPERWGGPAGKGPYCVSSRAIDSKPSSSGRWRSISSAMTPPVLPHRIPRFVLAPAKAAGFVGIVKRSLLPVLLRDASPEWDRQRTLNNPNEARRFRWREDRNLGNPVRQDRRRHRAGHRPPSPRRGRL